MPGNSDSSDESDHIREMARELFRREVREVELSEGEEGELRPVDPRALYGLIEEGLRPEPATQPPEAEFIGFETVPSIQVPRRGFTPRFGSPRFIADEFSGSVEESAPWDRGRRSDEGVSLSTEVAHKMAKAVDTINGASRHRYDGFLEILNYKGKKERKYLEELQEKSLPGLEEVIKGEIPVAIGWLDNRGMGRDLADEIHGMIKRDDNRGYEFHCMGCSLRIPYDFAFVVIRQVMCPICVMKLDKCDVCNELSPTVTLVAQYDGEPARICDSCKRKGCSNCGEDLDDDRLLCGLCEECLDYENPDDVHRNYSRKDTFVGTELGKIIRSHRTFSAEIEAMTSSGYAKKMTKELPGAMGICDDGSLSGESDSDWTFETQTPKLAGSVGEEFIKGACETFKKYHVTVNKSCGLHVHLEGRDLFPESRREYPRAILNLFKTYLVFEDVLFSFIPSERRSNDYCRPLASSFKLSELNIITSLFEFEKLWYKEKTYRNVYSSKNHHYHSSRYFGANFHSLLAHGHFEIRYHSGTTNARKILEWANLHALILDKVKEGKFHTEVFDTAQALSLSEKTELLFSILNLKQESQKYFLMRQGKFAKRRSQEEHVSELELAVA